MTQPARVTSRNLRCMRGVNRGADFVKAGVLAFSLLVAGPGV